jgi:hypothetical protein
MKSFFVGSKSKPSFLVEVTPKKIFIYKPDEISKNESFYERYSLGEKIETTYSKILFKEPISYKHHFYVPQIIVKIKKKQYLIKNKIYEISLNKPL